MSFIVGNDVSTFQGDIDWNTYKNNTNFVIIRSSYGNGYKDDKFENNQKNARDLKIPVGYYHYCYPQYNTPQAEADWFLSVVNVQDGEILCLDFEEAYAGDKVAWSKGFLDRISDRLKGYKALIYLNQSLATNNDWSPVVNAGYGLWIAAYTYDPTNNNFKIGKWPFAAMQQWTDRQIVPGIPTKVDGDVFFGGTEAFGKYGYHKPIDNPAPVSNNGTTDANGGTSTETSPQTPPAPTQETPTNPAPDSSGSNSPIPNDGNTNGNSQLPTPGGNDPVDNTGNNPPQNNPPATNQGQANKKDLLSTIIAFILKLILGR